MLLSKPAWSSYAEATNPSTATRPETREEWVEDSGEISTSLGFEPDI